MLCREKLDRLLNIKPGPRRVELVTDAGCFEARFVIAADGALGIVAKIPGWKESQTLIPALVCQLFFDPGCLLVMVRD